MTDTAPPPRRTLDGTVHSLARAMDTGGLLTVGDVAGLRRMDPRHLTAAGFFKLLGTVLADAVPRGGPARDDAETRWAAITVGLAHLGHLHRPGARLGRALVEAQLSEARFVRLLRSDADRLVDEIPALARFLAAKDVPADFSEAARLILSEGRADEERTRRQLARDFYAAQNRNDSPNT